MLLELFNRGEKNGCQLEILKKEHLYEYESLALTYRNFLWSPNTWSISPFELLDCLIKECKSLNINFSTGERIISASNNHIETSKNNKFYFDFLINACGGYAIEVAKIFGIETNYRLLPFKGLYLKSSKKFKKFKSHIYPVPDMKEPFLGIHTTITSEDYLKLGPTAIPAFSPENYTLFEGLDFKLSKEILILQLNLLVKNEFGFRDLAFREIQYLIKNNILKKTSELTSENLRNINFEWHSPGIRAQLFNQSTKSLEKDFVLINKDNTFHILNSISPAWTCSFINAKETISKISEKIKN